MKTKLLSFLFLIMLVFAFGQWASAAQDLAEPGLEYYPPYPGPQSGWSYSYCRAETVCPNGQPIACWTYGNSYNYTACNWYVVPGRYVECRGFNDYGQWITAWAQCY